MADVGKWPGLPVGRAVFMPQIIFDQKAVRVGAEADSEMAKRTSTTFRPKKSASIEAHSPSQGNDSPHRKRSVEENLDLFQRMKAGEFPDGSRVLRAKIDMASPNLNLRDPVMYRILHAEHHRTGNKWCIYPMYDYAHGQSDSLERVTHSMCTLEFEDHRPLYNWFIQQLGIFPSQQIEFDRLNLTHTLLSKRKLRQLVEEGRVSGWDKLTRGCTTLSRHPATRLSAWKRSAMFSASIGVSKTPGSIELAMLEHFVREDLNRRAPRVMAVLRPLKVVIDNYPENQVDQLDSVNNPEDPAAGSRKVPFSRVLYIEQEDFREVPPAQKYFRLTPGREVRLRYGYFITCTSVVKNEKGAVVGSSLHLRPCDEEEEDAPDGRRVKATIHWVSAAHADRCRGAHLREPVSERGSERRGTGPGCARQSQPEFAGGDHYRREAGAVAGNRHRRNPLPVRASGIFLC